MLKEPTAPGLVDFLCREDVDVVLGRLPDSVKFRLRDVVFSGRSYGVRWLGSVRKRGRRDIDLYSRLPARVSLGRFLVRGQSAAEFGAPARGQWPPWAVRRFLLYDVLLHELGHLQEARPGSRSWRRRFAGETLAQRFADEWRQKLWGEPFNHPDPVHHPPQADELGFLPVWEQMSKQKRFLLVTLALDVAHRGVVDSGLPGLQRCGFWRRARQAFGSPAMSAPFDAAHDDAQVQHGHSGSE